MIKWISGVLAALLPLAAAHADTGAVAVPKGAKLLLSAGADGVQVYACTGGDKGFSLVFKAPEAVLFDADGRQILTHFAGPSWKEPDGTTLVGEVVAKADAPMPGAIPWLLLHAKSREGAGLLSKADFIRRIDTKGGLAPATGCEAAHAGQEARMRYSAVYEFYQAGE
ncbi:MAG: hypothetical protein QOJ54_1826 [Aliidongia sp.]|nr:hypothetical protein [Aliidongia sp.]